MRCMFILGTPAGGEYYIAVYTYSSTEPGDLNFAQGETILVTNTESGGDWWTGQVQDRKGIFPGNYVKKMEVCHNVIHVLCLGSYF